MFDDCLFEEEISLFYVQLYLDPLLALVSSNSNITRMHDQCISLPKPVHNLAWSQQKIYPDPVPIYRRRHRCLVVPHVQKVRHVCLVRQLHPHLTHKGLARRTIPQPRPRVFDAGHTRFRSLG